MTTQHALCVAVGIEYLQAIELFGNTGKLDGRARDLAHGQCRTTARVTVEENNDKTPVNYVLPPGISRTAWATQSSFKSDFKFSLSITNFNSISVFFANCITTFLPQQEGNPKCQYCN